MEGRYYDIIVRMILSYDMVSKEGGSCNEHDIITFYMTNEWAGCNFHCRCIVVHCKTCDMLCSRVWEEIKNDRE